VRLSPFDDCRRSKRLALMSRMAVYMSMKCLTLQHGDVALSQTSQTDAKYPVLPNVVFCSLLGSNIRIFIIIFPPQMMILFVTAPAALTTSNRSTTGVRFPRIWSPDTNGKKKTVGRFIFYTDLETLSLSMRSGCLTTPSRQDLHYRFTKRDYLEYYTSHSRCP
jgi:hypothetical protein